MLFGREPTPAPKVANSRTSWPPWGAELILIVSWAYDEHCAQLGQLAGGGVSTDLD